MSINIDREIRQEIRKLPTWKLREEYDKLKKGEQTSIGVLEKYHTDYAITAVSEALWERGKLPEISKGMPMTKERDMDYVGILPQTEVPKHKGIKEGDRVELKSASQGWIKARVVEYTDLINLEPMGGSIYTGPAFKVHVMEGKHKGETIRVPAHYVRLVEKGRPSEKASPWPARIRPDRGQPQALPNQLMSQTVRVRELENGDIGGLELWYHSTGHDWMTWKYPVEDKLAVLTVSGIKGLTRKRLMLQFRFSMAKISRFVSRHNLPFAGADKNKMWWLATIDGKTVEVEVSEIQPKDFVSRLTGIRPMSIIELENAFNDSTATMSVETR